MYVLTTLLSLVATFFIFYALGRLVARRRARVAAAAADAAWQLEFARLSRKRGFRREHLRRRYMLLVNADPLKRHLPRRVRRELARLSGNAAFRRERGLPTPESKSHRRRAMRVAYDLLSARGIWRTLAAAATA